MRYLQRKITSVLNKSYSPYLFLTLIIMGIYYKLFLFGKIPFPGDLLIGSYSPWFDYYKIPVQNPLISDVFSQFFLWKYLAVDIIKSLEWPLWNPYSFSGTPLLATYHSATLYPLNLILFLPKYVGWGLFIFSQTLISSISMYLLLKIWIKSKLAMILGAIIFALSSLMTTWLELGTAGHAMAWLPLSFLSIELFFRKRRFRYLLLLTLSLTFVILAGNAQVTTYSFSLIFLWIIINSWNKNIKTFLLNAFFPLSALIFSIILSSIQLIPSIELLQNSIRLSESYTSELNFGLLPAKDILKFFIADFFGNPVTRNYWGNLNYSETSAFVGTLTLPLILYSYIYLRKSKITPFFLFILPICLILTFDNPISRLIYNMKIPLLTSSYASRMLFVVAFLISILSAFSIDSIITGVEIKKFFKVVLWSWAAVLGTFIGTIIAHHFVKSIINSAPSEKYLAVYKNSTDFALVNFSVSEKNSLIPLFLISFYLLFFFVRKIKITSRYSASLICIFLLLITILDLGRYFIKFNPFVSSDLIFPKTPALEYLTKQPGLFRVGREHVEVFPPNTWTAYKLQSYEGYDPIYLNQYGKFIHFLNGGDIRMGNSSRYAELSSDYHSPYLDSANAKYFIAILRDDKGRIPGDQLHYKVKETGYELVFKDKSAAILKNPNALERVYFAPSIITLPEGKIMDLMMNDINFDPRKTTALSKDLDINTVTGMGQIIVTNYSPNQVRISTNNSSDEILVLADQYEKGWRFKMDGSEEKEISPANIIFRAVKIPAGKHEGVFYYWPQSFDLGFKISITMIGFLTISSFFCIKKKIF